MFANTLRITGTHEEFYELIKPLENLGYTKAPINNITEDVKTLIIFKTGYFEFFTIPKKYGIEVEASNQRLVLALAAMRDDGLLHPGEAVFVYNSSTNLRIVKYISQHSVHFEDGTFANPPYEIRKATVQEIMDIFLIKPERKIIGYKTPMDMFEGQVKKGLIYKKFTRATYVTEYGYPLPKEIVESWEPVYREEKKNVPFKLSSGWEILISKDKIVIPARGGETVPFSEIIMLYNSLNSMSELKFSGYRVKLVSAAVYIGCETSGQEVTLQELENIISIVKDLNK